MTRKRVMMRVEKAVVIIRVRCVDCGDERDIDASEVPVGEHPMCPTCFMPMIAVKARHAKERAKGKK